MSTEQKEKRKRSLQKRFIGFALFFSFICAITILTATTPFEDLAVKELVLKENPDFVIERESGSKNSGIEYKILFYFTDLKDTLNISGTDLEYANRKAIQNELKAGDKVKVTFHDSFLYICQLSKNDKTYMDPQNAFENGSVMDIFVFWISFVSAIICIVGVFLARFSVKNAGWLCGAIILLCMVVLFFSLGVHFSNTIEYVEFNK